MTVLRAIPAEEERRSSYSTYKSSQYDNEPLVSLVRRAQAQDQRQRRRRVATATSSASESTSSKQSGSSTDITSTSSTQSSSSATTSSSSTSSTSSKAPSPSPQSYPPSAASFFVPSLPGQPPDLDLTIYSGHLPASYSIDESRIAAGAIRQTDAVSDAHLFFLLAKAKHIAERPRLVLWFNGGPGCSSFDGALLEIGPVLVEGSGNNAKLVENPGRWNEYANVLFIDQPAGTGYSYINKGKAVTELAPAADQIVTFLDNFYTVFPEYARMDTYISGESYAGTTIPYLAKAIRSSKLISTRVKGLIIGNGWFDPAVQYPAYAAYGKERGFLDGKNRQVQHVESISQSCNKTLASPAGKGHVLVGVCESLIDAVVQAARTTFDTKKYCINAYDVRPSTNCGEYPSGIRYTTPYLRNSQVVEDLNASSKKEKWVQCNNTVGSQMWSPRSRPAIELVPELLNYMPMLWFAGDADLMCNWIGIHDSIEAMTWKGAKGFQNATDKDWYVNGTLAGTWKTARNMTFVKVLDAGHMVPVHKPYEAHDMLLRFMGVETLTAAGGASRIPSSVGASKDDTAVVVGKVAPDGGTLPAVISQQEQAQAAAASKAAAAVDLAGAQGQPIDKERELMYGPRRSAVLLVIILAVALGIYGLLRWRAKQRRLKGWVPRSASARQGLSHSRSDRSLQKWSSVPNSASGTPTSRYPMSRMARTFRDSMNVPESTLLQKIEELEESGQAYNGSNARSRVFGDDGLEEAAQSAFALGDEEEEEEEEYLRGKERR